ncbi:alpha-ketoglutarate-dependent dioxygenase AlkB [Brachymonas denitrificans]|uniref:Alkylated DNA repair dioxygenase AlkB n=1 Tax=Brachymonas denitrificans DSM 15123 TaxID=1121117 RepID=A0A1H8DRJ9_9BURK|nr:alpha-ketoglutarate-dependent dioxygenase AlkB [Brachymonas denitrificans]SEN09167.1 Alkylated DNA repair dioxygenase AlkB [Brachymonas denitrificans DSM 15123]
MQTLAAPLFPARPAQSTQGSLFDPQPLRLISDAEGGVRYWPPRMPEAEQQRCFAQLLQALPWQQERRQMYERMLDVPRLQASLPLAEACAIPAVRVAYQLVQEVAPSAFSHVGFNLYRDGQDSVAMHNDRLHRLAPGQPIALVSFGHAREMVLRAKNGGHRPVRVLLEPGSVLSMSHASQFTHKHGIPKTRDSVGARISCAFRVRPSGL